MTALRQTMNHDLQLRNLAEGTRLHYIQCVATYACFFGVSPDKLDKTHVRGFLLHLYKLGRAPATIKVYWAALLFLYTVTLQNPEVMAGIPRPRVPNHPPLPALTRQEVQALLDAASSDFDRPFFSLLYATGLRISEACVLQPADIDAFAGLLYVRHGKGDKPRAVRLSPHVLALLRDHWRAARPPNDWLFPAQRILRPGVVDPEHRWQNHAVSTSTMGARFARIRTRAALRRHVTPHDLRRAHATHLREDGVDQSIIQSLLGHADPKTTARYTSVSAELIQRTPCPLEALGKPGRS